MKRIITTLAVLALISGTSFAGSNVNEAKIKQAEKGYKFALDSENVGVRNGALYQIATIKTRVPKVETGVYEKMLNKVINNDSEVPFIRVNAKMAMVVLNDEVSVEDLTHTKDPNVFFNSIYEQLTDLYAAR